MVVNLIKDEHNPSNFVIIVLTLFLLSGFHILVVQFRFCLYVEIALFVIIMLHYIQR